MEKLPEEYFQLVREALKEERKSPLRKKRKYGATRKGEESTAPQMIINLDSEPGSLQSDELTQSDEDYNSDEFEDVSNASPVRSSDIHLTLDTSKVEPKQRTKNVVAPEERKFRRYYHTFHLLCLLVHGHLRNEWLNDRKLHKKLSKLVPDQVFDLLHPPKDIEMPLRSTRKLLDGLKRCLEIWEKHFRHITLWGSYGMYMIEWDDLDGPWEQPSKIMTQKLFNRAVISGQGSRIIGAQGFVAMLRACGLNARLVLNAQPPDFTDAKISNKENLKADIEQPEIDSTVTAAHGNATSKKKRKRAQVKAPESEEEKYPIFWCEVWDKISKRWITVDPMGQKIIEQIRNKSKLEPQGKARKHNILRYVIGFDRKKGCRDITRRYVLQYNSKTRKRRITKDTEGKVWYEKVITRLHERKRTRIDDFEDEYFSLRDESEGIPDNLQDFKNHPFYVLENDLKWNEILRPNCKECGFLRSKNANSTMKVYKRKDIWVLKSAQRWYNEGRILKTGAASAKTINSKDFKTGESIQERLYPFEETELFVPKPLGPNNEVPKNHYGNIDVYTPTMIPSGACLIESPVAVKAAAFVGIEFAKAVTGFKFEKHRVAKPQITGVVVSQEYRQAVETMIDGIEESMREDKRQEHELEALQFWSLLLAKLRIKQRLNARHGKVSSDTRGNVWNKSEEMESQSSDLDEESFEAGGFLPEAGGFLPEAGGFLPEADEPINNANAESLQSSINSSSQRRTFSQGPDSSQNPKVDEEAVSQEEEGGFLAEEPGDTANMDLEEDYENFMRNLAEEDTLSKTGQSDSEFIYESE